MLRAHGDLPLALVEYEASLEISKSLGRLDPGNADWQRDLVVGYYRLGHVHQQLGDLSERNRHVNECAATLRAMREHGMHLDPQAKTILKQLDRAGL